MWIYKKGERCERVSRRASTGPNAVVGGFLPGRGKKWPFKRVEKTNHGGRKELRGVLSFNPSAPGGSPSLTLTLALFRRGRKKTSREEEAPGVRDQDRKDSKLAETWPPSGSWQSQKKKEERAKKRGRSSDEEI